MTSLFDKVRTAYPHLGVVVSAYEPGGAVTLECLTQDGAVYTFSAPTLEAVVAEAFPELNIEPPTEAPQATPSVFD